MAGKQQEQRPILNPSEDSKPRLSKRDDLNNAVGIIVTLPDHGADDTNRVSWGRRTIGGMYSDEFYQEFSREMETAVEEVQEFVPSAPPLNRTQPSHLYETGPDAQTWPQIALMLWEDVRPYLQDIDTVISLSIAAKMLQQSILNWHEKKNEEIMEEYSQEIESGRTPTIEPVEPAIVITQGVALAAAVTDVVQRHGVAGRLHVETYPRGFPGYSDAGHPSSSTSYLVRCRANRRSFFYHFLPDGEIQEHFLVTGPDVTMLSLPPNEHGEANMFRTAFPGMSVKIPIK